MPIPHHTFEFEGDNIYLLPQEPWKVVDITPIKWLMQSYPKFLHTPDHILKNSVLYTYGEGPNKGGIYFLIQESEIVYVGQSNTIYNRLIQHRKSQLTFSHFWCFGGIPEMHLEDVELFYIYTLEPLLNNKYPPLYEPAKSFVKLHKQGKLHYGNENC
ncbi:hypothetical protein C8R34_11374 [Nitrosomonas sp. Nm84]|nr:hypothetical protein C8R34_11374 [Nitrosomonas sp. Nm84]